MKAIYLAVTPMIFLSLLACNLLAPAPVVTDQGPQPQILTETKTPEDYLTVLPYIQYLTETKTPIIEWLTVSPTTEKEITKTPILLGWTPEPPTTEVTPAGPQTPFTDTGAPVSGTVLIEEGRCCVGGVAGSEIQIGVAFQAASSYGNVNEMRVLATGGGCRREQEMGAAIWEPFSALKTYPFNLPINWVGFYVSVQYRDTSGNISPVICDDISVEGSPPMPTP
jgi:hypothetical protein